MSSVGSEVLSCHKSHVQLSPVLFISPYENWDLENGYKKSPICWPLQRPWVIESDVCLIGASGILSAPATPWQAHLLNCRRAKSQIFLSSWHQLIKTHVCKTISQTQRGCCVVFVKVHFSANYPGKVHYVPVPRNSRAVTSVHILLFPLKDTG